MDRKDWMEKNVETGKKAKKIGIDDLIREIHDTEAPDLPGFVEKEQQDRIEARILAGIFELQEKEGTEKAPDKILKKKGRKRYFVMALAAVLLMGLCFSVFAGTNPDWDVEILKFMGLDGGETFQLESGEVEIHVYDVCNDIKVMAVSSIGDRNSACIRIETDYELPEGFDEKTDYILPGDYSLNVRDKTNHFIEHGSTMGYVNMDGKLGYMIYITGCKGINKAQIEVTFEDFYLYHDLGMKEGGREEELLLPGSWELKWTYAYKSNTKRYKMLKPVEINGETLYIRKIDISPLSVQIDGFRMPWKRKYGHAEFSVDRIWYKDGTSLEVGGWSSSGNRDGIWIDTFLGTVEMKSTIDVEKVESIVIEGNVIKLR